MSKYKLNFIDYYKIRWARRSTWSLEEAAYLSCGLNPELKGYKLDSQEDNFVSKRYYWLKNKYEKNHLFVMDNVEGVPHFESGAICRLLEEKNIPIDDDMDSALFHMHNAHLLEDVTGGIVTRTIFREAGRLVFEMYPKARISDVALAIEPLFVNLGGLGK